MNNHEPKLYDLVNTQDPDSMYGEIRDILKLFNTKSLPDEFEVVYQDTVRLFQGTYPGYRASNTKYHNLEHTAMVTLATARLIHGCAGNGMLFQPDNIFTALTASLFHDAGLIQTDQEQEGTGARHTIGHEDRSAMFTQEYLYTKNYSKKIIADCAHMIICTDLEQDVGEIPFRSKEIETLGKIVGSSDLLAQIADRHYLEKLLLLFKEFKEAGMSGFDSEEQLLYKTEGFYKNVARKRLTEDFDNLAANMRYHFKEKWNIDRDLYQETIENNIKYLKAICRKNFNREDIKLFRHLRRGGIVSIS